MTANVEMDLSRVVASDDAKWVPASAVQAGSGLDALVWKIDPDSMTVIQQAVQIGRMSGDQIEVTDVVLRHGARPPGLAKNGFAANAEQLAQVRAGQRGEFVIRQIEHLLHPGCISAEPAEEHGDRLGSEAVRRLSEQPGLVSVMVFAVDCVAQLVQDHAAENG